MAGGIIGSLMYAVGFKFNSKGINDADKKVGKLTKGVIGLGAAAATAAAGIAAAGFNAADKFETAMLQVQGATGSAAAQMEETRGIAKDLYANNFGESWDDLGSAIANVQQVTGQTGAELEDTTRYAILMRDQFKFEIPESIKAVDTMMKQFGTTSEESYNLLAQGAQRGLDKSGELVDSANEYANQFKSLGFTANEMFDLFAAGSAEGVFQVDKVGDAVKEFNIRSKDASKTSMDAFTALGLNAEAMMQVFARGGPDAKQAFSDIVSMISDIADPVARNNIGVALMGSQFEDLEISVISAMGAAGKSFDMTAKTMDELNKIKFSKPGEAMRMFGRQIEVGILIPIGQKLLPYMNKFGQWLSDHRPQIEATGNAIGNGLGGAISKVSGWVKTALPYLQHFGGQAAVAFEQAVDKGKELWNGLKPIVILLGQDLLGAAQALWPELQHIAGKIYDVGSAVVEWEPFIPIVSGITAALLTYKGMMFAVTTATKIAGLATKAWGAVTKTFIAVQTAFNAVMAMNPIMLVVLALVGLGVALTVAYKRSDKFRAVIDKMWTGIKDSVTETMDFFKITIPRAFKTAFDAVTGFIKKWGITILAVLGGPITMIALLVYKNWDKIKAFTISVFTGIWNWLKSAWNWIGNTVSDAFGSIWNIVSGGWEKMKGITTSAYAIVWSLITQAWNKIVSTVTSAGSKLLGAVSSAWAGVKTAVNTGMDFVKGIVSSGWDWVVNSASTVGSGIASKLSGAFDSVKSTFSSALNWIIDKFNGLIGKLNKVSIKNPINGDEIAGINIPLIPKIDGSHANGLANVPKDGYIAELHKNERVLTAKENEAFSKMPQWNPKDFVFPEPFVQVEPIFRMEKSEPVSTEQAAREPERYTPDSAPARTTNNQRIVFTAPPISIKIEGNADKQTVQQVGDVVDEKLQGMLEALARILGVEINGAY